VTYQSFVTGRFTLLGFSQHEKHGMQPDRLISVLVVILYGVSFTMASSMSLQHMPIEVTAHILRYVGNANDLLNCEKTCKTLRRILRDEAVWNSSPGGSRDGACQFRGFQNVRKYQKGCESILLEVIGVVRWKMLVRQAVECFISDDTTNDQLLLLRGDTSAVLMELVENFAVVQLKRAGVVMNATTSVESQTYPTVTVRHWDAQNELHSAFVPKENSTCTPLFAGVLMHPIPRDAVLSLTNALLLGKTMITTIIRRLAYRAGIIKMEDGVFVRAWGSLVCSIVALLRPACIELDYVCSSFDGNLGERQKILCAERGESMYTVPPCSRFAFCGGCGEPHIVLHTPVPGQIEAAARSLSIPFKVYGDVWHCMPDSMEEDERTEAESEYLFLTEDELEEYGYMDKSDSDSDSDSDDAMML
jgi:hypothetical protein